MLKGKLDLAKSQVVDGRCSRTFQWTAYAHLCTILKKRRKTPLIRYIPQCQLAGCTIVEKTLCKRDGCAAVPWGLQRCHTIDLGKL